MTSMRQETDQFEGFPPHGQGLNGSWSTSHPSEPITEPRPRVTAKEKDERTRRRPHRRYQSPEDMWKWHWVRMRILLAWTAVGTACGVTVTVAVEIISEFV